MTLARRLRTAAPLSVAFASAGVIAGCGSPAAPDRPDPDAPVSVRGVLHLGGCNVLRTASGQYQVRDLPAELQRPAPSQDSVTVRATGVVRNEPTTCMVGPMFYIRTIVVE